MQVGKQSFPKAPGGFWASAGPGIAVLEALGRLRESPEYELCQISEKKPGVLDELAVERASELEKESTGLEKQAQRLAAEIEELAGEKPFRIT